MASPICLFQAHQDPYRMRDRDPVIAVAAGMMPFSMRPHKVLNFSTQSAKFPHKALKMAYINSE